MIRLTLILAVAICLYIFAEATGEYSNGNEKIKRKIGRPHFLPVLDNILNKQHGFQKAIIADHEKEKIKTKNLSKMFKWLSILMNSE